MSNIIAIVTREHDDCTRVEIKNIDNCTTFGFTFRDDMSLTRQRIMVDDEIDNDYFVYELMRTLYSIRVNNNVPEYDVDDAYAR